GQCKGAILLDFFSGQGPAQTANCRPNEVQVPNVLGLSYDDETAALSNQPLRTQPVYKPAKPGQRVGVVIGEIPSIGTYLTALDTVRLVLAKPLHGVVPSVLGLSTRAALERLAGQGLKPVVGGLLAN